MRPSTDIRVLLLERDLLSEKNGAVFGKLYINGVYFCDTLENKKFLVSRGNYSVSYCDSPKFGRKLPLWFNSSNPPERGLRIHAGNSKDDSQGCILVGERYYSTSGVISEKLKSSKDTLQKLCDIFETDTKVNDTVLLIRTV